MSIAFDSTCYARRRYLEALRLDKDAMRRESVFVFVRTSEGSRTDGSHGRLFEMPAGATIGNVKEACGFGGEEVPKLNGRGADWDSRVGNGDVVFL